MYELRRKHKAHFLRVIVGFEPIYNASMLALLSISLLYHLRVACPLMPISKIIISMFVY